MTLHDPTEGRKVPVKVRLDEELHSKLAELAELNDRPVGAEARVAIRAYVDSQSTVVRPTRIQVDDAA